MNDDLISRQALRSEMYHEAFEKDSDEQRWDSGCWIRYKMFERVVDRQPSAQPDVPDTNVGDMISRQAAIAYSISGMTREIDGEKWIRVSEVRESIKTMPEAQPERHFDEWCDTCKEYDHERHCCPRWNHVIRTTLQDVQAERKKGKWKLNKEGNWACPFCEFDPYHDNMKGMNYCPNCGARLEVEE